MLPPHVLSTLVVVVSLCVTVSSQQRWYETAQLKPTPGLANQQFGAALALSDGTALVGAPTAEGPIGGSAGAGSATVFVAQGTDWVQQAVLDTPAIFSPAQFGAAVALDGDLAVVGLPLLDHGGSTEQGAVAVFVRSAGVWSLEAQLLAPDIELTPQHFGAALALHGDTIAVGAPDADENTKTGAGAVYVFVRNGGTWSQQARLLSPQPQFNAAFGSDLDIEDDTLFVGEPHATPQGGLTSAGAGQMFDRVGTSWSHDVTLFSLDIAPFDDTGLVALSGDRAVLGSPGLFGPGELTTFERQGGNWVADQWIFDLTWNGTGRSVDIDGTTVVTGTTAFLGTGQRPGALIYDEAPAGWVSGPVAWARDGNSGNQSAFWTAIYELDGDTLLVGSPLHDGAAEDGGIVHVFTRDGPWSDLQNTLKGTSFAPPLLYAAGSLASPSTNELLLAGLPGGGDAYLLASAVNLSVPFKGGVLVPAPDVILGPIALPTSQPEAVSLPFHMPPGLPVDVTFFTQFWFADPGGPQGFAASNALAAKVQ